MDNPVSGHSQSSTEITVGVRRNMWISAGVGIGIAMEDCCGYLSMSKRKAFSASAGSATGRHG